MMERGYLKVALSTNSLTRVDADFISARQFVIYDVTPDEAAFKDCVQFGPGGVRRGGGNGTPGGEGCWMAEVEEVGTPDRLQSMIDTVRGCSVLFTLGISDLQALKVKDAEVFPISMSAPREIAEVLSRLQTMLADNPPLWMVRALKGEDGRRLPLHGL